MPHVSEATRLFLVTPPRVDAGAFPSRLAAALSGGNVAAVLIALDGGPDTPSIAEALISIAQNAGAAAIVADDIDFAERLAADGVQIGTGLADLRRAVARFRPQRSVGAGDLRSRHAAMEAGEAGADYVFFGRPHGDTREEPHPAALELAEWWSALMQVPAVVMAGSSLTSVERAAATGAAFVALHDAVWRHEHGPAEAIRLANALVARAGRQAA